MCIWLYMCGSMLGCLRTDQKWKSLLRSKAKAAGDVKKHPDVNRDLGKKTWVCEDVCDQTKRTTHKTSWDTQSRKWEAKTEDFAEFLQALGVSQWGPPSKKSPRHQDSTLRLCLRVRQTLTNNSRIWNNLQGWSRVPSHFKYSIFHNRTMWKDVYKWGWNGPK